MEFNLAEKLAIVKAIDDVIFADGDIDEEEIHYLGQLMKVLEIDIDFIQEARKFNPRQAGSILQGMNEAKKHRLSIMLQEMAKADGKIHKEEMKVITSVFVAAGIDVNKTENYPTEFDVSDIYFESSDHIRYENMELKNNPQGGRRRAIKVEKHSEGMEEYNVTCYNLEDVPSLWGHNIEMVSKQMRVIESQVDKTVLRGHGDDPMAMGHPDGRFSDYGISILHPNNEIEKIILHLHHHKVDIEYIK